MFNILNALFLEETKALIAKAYEHSALSNKMEEDKIIELTHRMKDELR
jgi:outer membrane lipopolysaccharide assembly protein LptE/RlpB